MSKRCVEQLRRLVVTGMPVVEAAAFLFVERAERLIMRLEQEIGESVAEFRLEEPQTVHKNPLQGALERRAEEFKQWLK